MKNIQNCDCGVRMTFRTSKQSPQQQRSWIY